MILDKASVKSWLLLLFIAMLPVSFVQAGEAVKPQFKIRWLLAHEPVRVFERAALQFKTEVERESKGRISVEVLTASEYRTKYGVDKQYTFGEGVIDDVMLVKDGKVEMTQTYTTELGRMNPTMWVLDLPFLFRDHKQAKTVMDGPVGAKIMAGLSKSNMKGLAFTYSGGFRVITTRDRGIEKVEDFQSMTIRTSSSPVAKATLETLGAITVPMNHDVGVEAVAKGSLTATETTVARIDENQKKATPVLNDTKHSLFLTSMVINQSYYQTLPEDLRGVVASAAKSAAETERQDSIKDEASLRSGLSTSGLRVVTMSKSELAKMKKKTSSVYKQFEPMFGADLIESIQKAN